MLVRDQIKKKQLCNKKMELINENKLSKVYNQYISATLACYLPFFIQTTCSLLNCLKASSHKQCR